MTKLNLLKPCFVKGFLDGGRGDKVHFLELDENLGYAELEEDVKNGALQFKDCLKNADKELSRVVVVKGSNEEEVLMAVSYLACIANEQEGKTTDYFEDEDEYSDLYSFDDDGDDIWCEEEEEESAQWMEAPHKVPVITYGEISAFENEMSVFRHPNNMVFGGMPNTNRRKPYWFQCRKEMVCILVYEGWFSFGSVDYSALTEKLSRFDKNRHLFLAIVDETTGMEMDDEEEFTDKNGLFEYVIDNTADMILVGAKEEKLRKYRCLQFDNWLNMLEIRLERGVPKKDIINKIIKMRNSNKSDMMKNVLKYVKKESRKQLGEPLSKADFDIIKKFLVLKDKGEKKSAESLEKELIGMEAVKRQVKSIVNVMKYCKEREKKGLGSSGFHNVHLLIGAPGTAKTTVAQMMGNMMREEGLLPGNRFTCINGAELKGMFVGHSAPKTKQLFMENDIILIDEAYSLVDSDHEPDSFSREAMAQMIIEIEEHATDKLVMFAGYGGKDLSAKDNKMKQFLDANPGLKSRINSTIYFDSYTPDEMVEIVHKQAQLRKMEVEKDADNVIRKYFAKRYKDPNFGNGREARSLLENAMIFAAERVMKLPANKRTKAMMSLLTKEDMKNAVHRMQDNNEMQEGKTGKCGFIHPQSVVDIA